MSCAGERRLHQQVLRAVARGPRSFAASALGVAMVVLGAGLGADDRSLPLIVLGTGLFLSPNLEQFEFSGTSLKGTQRTRRISAAIESAEPEKDVSLQWMALLLCGDPTHATRLVERAYGSVAQRGPALSALEVRHHARCWLVRHVIDTGLIPRVDADPALSAHDAAFYLSLAPLHPLARAAIVLHQIDTMSEHAMAEMLRQSEEQIRTVLAEALAVVRAGQSGAAS
jgi:hypothetical protein